MSNALNDGLNKPSQLADNAVESAEMAYGQIVTGSPAAVGNFLQAGNGTSSTGSVLAVSFGTAFKAAPVSVVAQQIDGAYALLGSITTTGFTVNTVGASKVVYWNAVGSGSQ